VCTHNIERDEECRGLPRYQVQLQIRDKISDQECDLPLIILIVSLLQTKRIMTNYLQIHRFGNAISDAITSKVAMV
jgi:hypothetical protein